MEKPLGIRKKGGLTVTQGRNESVTGPVAAFGNGEGGTLLIGVKDDGEVIGLDEDFSSLKNAGRDGFELHLRNLLNDCFGTSFVTTRINLGADL